MEWMAWTNWAAIFFSVIALMLISMTIWQMVSPSVARRGWLPMKTTRGDRLFIGLLGSAYIHLLWLGLTSLSLWWAFAIALIFLIIIMRWG